MKYEEWLNEWLEYYEKPAVKQSTYEKYCRLAENHILPILGGYELSDLTAIALQKFTVNLSDGGLAPNTVTGIISVLKMSLHKAVSLGIAERQYADAIRRPKAREKRIECLSKDEQRKIENDIFASHKKKLYGIILCLYSGLRIGELIALEWSDLDLNKGLLSVTKTCHDGWRNGNYVKITDTPKTESSCRIIPLPKQLLPHLREMKKRACGKYVVEGKSEYGAQVRSYQRTFELLLRKHGIPHKGFHSLRHTFATRALECGMDVKTLSEILGHKNPTVTLQRYTHSLLEHKSEMMNRLGKQLP